MSRPRVVMVTRTYPPDSGAAPIRLAALTAALGAAGADVRVLTTRPAAGSETGGAGPGAAEGPAGPDAGEPHHPDVRRWPALRDAAGRVRGYLPYASFDLPIGLRLAGTPRPDVVVVEPPPTTGAVVRLVAALRAVPYAYYAADVMSTAAAAAGVGTTALTVLRALEGFALRGAAVVLTPSTGMADQLVALGARRERVVVVGTGTDTDAFTPAPPDGAPGGAAPLHHAAGTTDAARDADAPRGAPPAGTPLAVYAGTMSEVHGTEVLVRAFARAARRVPGAHLALVGDGTEHAALAALAHDLAPGRVTVTGQVPVAEVARWWRRAGVGLAAMPHYPVAHATKMFAATASGTPVVYAGPGPCAAMVVEGDLGWAVPWDVEAVADALVQALTHPPDAARRERLAAWTREHASLTTVAARAAAAVLACVRPGTAGTGGRPRATAMSTPPPTAVSAPPTTAPAGATRPSTPSAGGRTRFVLSATQPLRGMERAAAEVAGRLRAGGLDVETAVLDPGPPARTRAERARRLARSALAARSLVREADRHGDTLVLVGIWVALRALPWAGPRGGAGGGRDDPRAGISRRSRIVGWEHSCTRERAARSRSFAAVARAVLPLYAARADALVAVGPAVADALPAALAGRTAVIANPVAAEPAAPGQRARRPPTAPLRLVALGGLVPVKAPHLLLDALEALRARDVPAHLDVAGDGPLLAGLRQRALDADLDVTWHGHVADVAPLLAGADVLVHTALSETFGYALLEAAAAGVPVVAASTVQARHLVPHLVPGLVCVPAGDALALAVCAVLERPAHQRAAQAEAAWRARGEAFDPAALERAWRSVLGAPPVPAPS